MFLIASCYMKEPLYPFSSCRRVIT